jgi:hypothetical protein
MTSFPCRFPAERLAGKIFSLPFPCRPMLRGRRKPLVENGFMPSSGRFSASAMNFSLCFPVRQGKTLVGAVALLGE